MIKRVLITGGAGFIGSYVCKRLVQEGITPVVYDAFIQYVSPFESYYQKYLEYRFKGFKDKVVFERGDTRDKNDLRRVILKHKPEIIIHLAALPIADLSFTHSEEAIGSIIGGTVGILDTIRELDFVERFVYISSSMIYGDFQEIPATESHPKSPKDIYGGTKLAGEILTETYGRRYGIKYTIIRPSGVYGPTDVNRRVVQIFIENALNGDKLILHGGGENLIDFTFVEDAAEGIVLAAFSDKGENESFNITYGEGRSLKDCANILRNYFPGLRVENKPMQHHRPLRGSLCTQKARNALGYAPAYSFEEGIGKYIQFYKKIHS
jgi:nucleoside-diphosphate-sugar epimerase